MTKVLMNIDLLGYQWYMKDALRKVIQENFIGGIRQTERVEPPFARTVPKAVSPVRAESPKGRDGLREEKLLLPPPSIKCLSLHGYEGQGDDYIGIIAWHDFGIHAIHITILDERGKRIESGEAYLCPGHPELWDYLPTERVPLGTAVTVHVTAMDCMGGVGRWWESKTLGEAQY